MLQVVYLLGHRRFCGLILQLHLEFKGFYLLLLFWVNFRSVHLLDLLAVGFQLLLLLYYLGLSGCLLLTLQRWRQLYLVVLLGHLSSLFYFLSFIGSFQGDKFLFLLSLRLILIGMFLDFLPIDDPLEISHLIQYSLPLLQRFLRLAHLIVNLCLQVHRLRFLGFNFGSALLQLSQLSRLRPQSRQLNRQRSQLGISGVESPL